jgi:hypothetical protein
MAVKITWTAAVHQILLETGRPMTARELYGEIIDRGLVEPKGKTPFQTLVAGLYKETKRVDARISRVAEPGTERASWGTVRWMLKIPPR